MNNIVSLDFLTNEQVKDLAKKHGTPLYVYSLAEISKNVLNLLNHNYNYGLTVRYAMKANSNSEILNHLHGLGLKIDASSGYEAQIAIDAGFNYKDISIVSQVIPHNFEELITKGAHFTATSLHQLEEFGKIAHGQKVGVRINPEVGGDGMNNRLTTAGVAASFGIWHEYIPQIHEIVDKYGLVIDKVHTHMGTGAGSASESSTWVSNIKTNLKLLEEFPTATSTSVGGGFKVSYMPGDNESNISEIYLKTEKLFNEFNEKTGREIHLEIEPGKYIVNNAGALVTEILDKKDTGKNGHKFFIVDTGMNDFLRTPMYGAQHPLTIISKSGEINSSSQYGVSGHCCESGDSFTSAYGDPETLETRELADGEIGDYIVMGRAGAYCAGMRAKGYNAFPEAKEIIIE